MVHLIRSTWAVLAATCFVGLLGGCERELPPATALGGPVVPTPAPGQGAVVCIRPTSACDESDYSVVVDERGRFVGNVDPGTRVDVSVSPGSHAFYSWSSLDLRMEVLTSFNAAAAVRVDVVPSETQFVTLNVIGAPHCLPWPIVEMTAARTPGALANAKDLLASTKPVIADRVAGQAALDAKPNLLQTNIELARFKLQQLEEAQAHDDRRAAIAAEANR
jgi:hypothetical protein